MADIHDDSDCSTERPPSELREQARLHVSALDDLAWLRVEDITTLREKLLSGHEFAPLPRSPKLQRIAWLDLARLLGSHNAWVRLWNVHETDRSLPLSPEWWDGSTAAGVRPRRLFINEKATGRTILVGMGRAWEKFHPGSSFCRNEALLAQVVWAGVQRPKGREQWLSELTMPA